MKNDISTVKIFDIPIANVNMEEACKLTAKFALGKNNKAIFTPNANMLIKAFKDEKLFTALKKADVLLPDGISLVLASKRIGKSLKGKVSGSSYFEKSCSILSEVGANIFLLGAAEGVGEKVAKRLRRKYPKIKIVGTYSPPLFFEKNKIENLKVLNLLKNKEIDVLYVAMSGGRGEKWIIENRDKYSISCSIQVGAAFDFTAGIRKVPTEFVKRIGMAWLWRLFYEPQNIFKRFLKEDIKIIKYILLMNKDGSV